MADPEYELLPLFPLGLVLVPGELLPLYIFEERYKRLIAECRETGGPFGIVLSREEGLAVVGCAARVGAVLEEFSDGRLNIVVRGGERFRLVELRPPDLPDVEPLSALVEYLDDRPGEVVPETAQAVERLFAQALELTDSGSPKRGSAEVPRSFQIAGVFGIEPVVKQRLLQLHDESERLELLAGFFDTLVERLTLLKSREDAIRGNGKGN
jgi:ATP-dependent Lon protease